MWLLEEAKTLIYFSRLEHSLWAVAVVCVYVWCDVYAYVCGVCVHLCGVFGIYLSWDCLSLLGLWLNVFHYFQIFLAVSSSNMFFCLIFSLLLLEFPLYMC